MSARPCAVVLADDLTGACDTGVQLAGTGAPCPVVLGEGREGFSRETLRRAALDYGRLVADTESRHMEPDDARERVRSVANALHGLDVGVLYKKVDSTLRGRIAAEIDGVRSVFDDRVIVVAPAYPAAGRTTVDGLCLVDGVPVHRTEFGRDRRSPVASSRIADHLPADPAVRHATAASADRVLATARPGDMIVIDARTSDDLGAVAQRVAQRPERYLLVGSAGLAAALRTTGTLAPREPGSPSGDGAAVRTVPTAPSAVLGIVGSLSERSRAQADYVRRKREPFVLDVDPARPDDAGARAASALMRGSDVLVVTSPPRADEVRAAGDGNARADEVARAIGEIARQAISRVPDIGLFLTGGDTAVAVLDALNARVVRVHREVAPGVPALTIVARLDGHETDVPAITKAGGFGETTVMDEAFDSLREGRCWQ